MLIHFKKMHGLGNDFVVINDAKKALKLEKNAILQLANRHLGVGFDQLLIIKPTESTHFFCQIFNSDGSEAEQCGNGLRCVARFLYDEGLEKNKAFNIETKAGLFPVKIQEDGDVQVTLPAPELQKNLVELKFADHAEIFLASILNLGNPHTIIKVPSVDNVQTNQLGASIANHALFPQGTNVGFMEVVSAYHIRLRTYERGAGETYACGSNACAALFAGIANGWLDHDVVVEFKYGNLQITWDDKTAQIYMKGPAVNVFSGQITI